MISLERGANEALLFAQGEIERLRQALDVALKNVENARHDEQVNCERLTAERDEITARSLAYLSESLGYKAECDRLRAALERIAHGEFPMPDIAREALAGGEK